MAVVLTRPTPLRGSLTRQTPLRGVFTLQAYEGSLTQPTPLRGSFTRQTPLRGVFVEDYRPPELPAGAIQVGDLGPWRPRIRGVLGSGQATLAWKYLGGTTFSGGSTSLGPRVFATVPFARADISERKDQIEPARYVPGALRPVDANGFTIDTVRVSDSAAAHRDISIYFRDDIVPAVQDLDVPIGTDGVAASYSGGGVNLTASGGTGPYTWDWLANRSGGTLSVAGAYVAGPDVGIDRVRVTDAVGAIAYAQLEVMAGEFGGDMTVRDEDEWIYTIFGIHCIPYARVTGAGGTAPYSVELLDNQTGGKIIPAWPEPSAAGFSTRVRLEPKDAAGERVSVRRLNLAARAMRADGIAVGDVLVHPVSDWAVEMVLPHPGDHGLWENHLVLEVVATPADGGEVVVVQALFESPSESAYAAAQ